MMSLPPSPPPDAWLASLLEVCLADPTVTLHLPPYLLAMLLAPLDDDDPLYKQLATALLDCTKTSTPSCNFFQLVNTMRELMNCRTFRLHVQEPFFAQLKDGSKVIEGRCAAGVYNSILPGDALLFNDNLIVAVKRVNHYCSFAEMLEAEGMDHVLPGVTSIKEGIAIYRSFYPKEKELSKGVLAIHVERISEERQPVTIVQNILKEVATWDVETLRRFVVKV